MNIFAKKIRALEEDLAKRCSGTYDFPSIAEQSLRDFDSSDISVQDVHDFISEQHLNLRKTGFASPALIVSQNDVFWLIVAVWEAGKTTIHDHNFDGAFRVLYGSSLDVTYDYRLCGGVDLVQKTKLSVKSLSWLEPGKVSQVHTERTHAVFHFNNPTISLVAMRRTREKRLQHIYTRSGIRFPNDFKDISVKMKHLSSLSQKDSSSELISDYLTKESLPELLSMALLLYKGDSSVLNYFTKIKDTVREKFHEYLDIFETIEDDTSFEVRAWKQFKNLNEKQRLILALLYINLGNDEHRVRNLLKNLPIHLSDQAVFKIIKQTNY